MTPNSIPPFLSRRSAVVEVESPDNLIVLLFKLFNAVVLLVTLVLTSWSCPPLTASVLPAPTVPSATLVILFPPALIPELFMTTFPVGIVTLSKVTSLLVAIVKSFPD